MKNKNILCVNLGSGPVEAKGWLNIDWGVLPLLGKYGLNKWLCKFGILESGYGVNWPKIILRDIRRRLPFDNVSVDYIYCSHVLEHFEKFETKKILMECRRILKSEGILRIVLPDIDKLKQIDDADEFNKTYLGYDKDKFSGLLGKIMELMVRPHRWMYSYESFEKLLLACGFVKIKKCKIGIGNTPDLNILDLKIHENLSFYVEASY